MTDERLKRFGDALGQSAREYGERYSQRFIDLRERVKFDRLWESDGSGIPEATVREYTQEQLQDFQKLANDPVLLNDFRGFFIEHMPTIGNPGDNAATFAQADTQGGGLIELLTRIIGLLLGQRAPTVDRQTSASVAQGGQEEGKRMPGIMPDTDRWDTSIPATRKEIANHLQLSVQINDDWMMQEVRLQDSDFMSSLSEMQKSHYIKMRSDVLTEAMKNPEYAPILDEVQERVRKGGREAKQALEGWVSGARRREVSASGHYLSALEMQRMEHRMGSEYSAEQTGTSLPSITRHAAFGKLQEEIEAKLKEKIKQDAAFVELQATPTFGTEAVIRDHRAYIDEKVSKQLANVTEKGYQGKAIQEIFESEAYHVHTVKEIRHGEKHHLTPEDMAEKAGFTQALSDVTLFYASGYFDSSQRIDWHAKKSGDWLASTEAVQLYQAIGRAAEKLYKDQGFAKLSAQEAAKRIMEESVAGVMAEQKAHAQKLAMLDAKNKNEDGAEFGLKPVTQKEIEANAKKYFDENLKKTMPLIQQALKDNDLQFALQGTHRKTASALQTFRQNNPDLAKEQPSIQADEATSPTGPEWTLPVATPSKARRKRGFPPRV